VSLAKGIVERGRMPFVDAQAGRLGRRGGRELRHLVVVPHVAREAQHLNGRLRPRDAAVLILTPLATRRALIFHFALDSDPRVLASLSAARPIFVAPVALFGAWLSFRQRG
jgi:hypothetical protein